MAERLKWLDDILNRVTRVLSCSFYMSKKGCLKKCFCLFYRLNFIFYRLDIVFADTNMLFFSFLTVKAWVSTCSPNSKEDMCFPSHVMLNTNFRRTQILCQPLNFRKFVAASWRHPLVIMTNESKINKSMTLLGSMFRNQRTFQDPIDWRYRFHV